MPDASETVEQMAQRIFSEEVMMAKYDPTQVKWIDYEAKKLNCEHCGDLKRRGHLMITPIFPDDLTAGAFEFFFCGKKCAKEWFRQTRYNGFPLSRKRFDQIKQVSGRDYVPYQKPKKDAVAALAEKIEAIEIPNNQSI